MRHQNLSHLTQQDFIVSFIHHSSYNIIGVPLVNIKQFINPLKGKELIAGKFDEKLSSKIETNKLKTNQRRHTIRIPEYDYTQPGAYFMTICTHEKTCIFGEIIGSEIRLSPAGQIAQREWMRLDSRFQHINLDEFVIMPNHIHGIIFITCSGTAGDIPDKRHKSSRRAPTTGEQFGKPTPGSIPTIIRSYKSSVTLRAKRLRYPTNNRLWQRNYYEHIIRDEDDLNHTRQYIIDNPLKWEQDQYHQA